MREYLAAERAYYDRQLDTGLRNELAAELTARVLPAEESVRWRRGGRTYFTRTLPGREFEQFCNSHRPHQGIANARPLLALPPPIPGPTATTRLHIHRRDRLGGILHEYRHAA